MQKNCQNGRSMVEMLGVLAIVATLSVGGIAGYSKAMSKYKISKTLDQVQALVVDTQSLYSASPNYDINMMDNLRKTGGLSQFKSVLDGFNVMTINEFGGEAFTLPWNGAPSIQGQGFLLYMQNLPKAACIQLATADWGSPASNFVGLWILNNSTNVSSDANPPISWANGNLPINLNDASTLCTSVNDNSIAWVYR